ncbi:MAG: LysR substrate-binding domain-containing protein [Alphaproteobacteria bacterium]|nr:LysR substrate-binding domain-containing protein [Alphaproteobacteria bacterium]
MINVTLRQLRYFEALARLGHFGRAADSCAISQPALSMQIKEMEEELGGALLERGARQVVLTGLGTELATRARAILCAVDELGDVARVSRDRLAGALRIGMIPTVAPYLLPAIIHSLSTAHPELDIRVREALTSTLLQELGDGRLDTAIVALPLSERTLTEVSLFKENFLFVRPSADADQPVPDPDRLRQMRLLLLEEGHCFRDQALAFCHMHNPRADALDASSLSTLVQMVGAGIGVTLIPEMALAVESRAAPVAVARFPNPQPCRTIGMVWRKTTPLAAQLLQVAATVRQAATRASSNSKAPVGKSTAAGHGRTARKPRKASEK